MDSFFSTTEFTPQKVSTQLILESDFTKEIKITLANGAEMKKHKTPFPIVIQVLKGNINFSFSGANNEMKEGAIIALAGGIPHSLFANQDSVVRLTLAKHDSYKRVDNLVI